MSTPLRVGFAATAVALIGMGLWLLRSEEPKTPEEQPLPVAKAPVDPAPVVAVPVASSNNSAVREEQTREPRPDPAAAMEVEAEPSPFNDPRSRELQYAVQLVIGPNTGPEQWQKAAEVFKRCTQQNPRNYLCQRGLAGAYERLESDGGPTHLFEKATLTPSALPLKTQ